MAGNEQFYVIHSQFLKSVSFSPFLLNNIL
jgi:hypothetical protein